MYTLELDDKFILTHLTEQVEHIVIKVDMLNDWHNKVTGALLVLGVLASAGLVIALRVLDIVTKH